MDTCDAHVRGGRLATQSSTRAVPVWLCAMFTALMSACGGDATPEPSAPVRVPVATVSIALGATSIIAGQTTRATATARDAAGTTLTDRAISWSSSNTGVASIDASGLVTAVAAGATVITASVEGRSGEAALTVQPIPVASIDVTTAAASLEIGETGKVTATLRDAAGAVLTNRAVTWSSSTPTVATVDATGTVTALTVGSTSITATSEGRSATVNIAVRAVPVATVELTLPRSIMLLGSTATATARARDKNGVVLSDRVITFISSAPATVTVSASGVITTLAVGSATITATSESKSATAAITVQPVPVAGVTVALIATSATVRTATQASATARDSVGAPLANRPITWSSSDTLIAQVDASGSVFGIRTGTVNIIATSEGKSGQTSFTVTPSPLLIKGVYTQFDRPGWGSGFWPGDAIRNLETFDNVVGQTVRAEIGAQMDAIRSLGANTITFELRSSDSTSIPGQNSPPTCHINRTLGLLWPQPSQQELTNLRAFFDLAQSKQLKVLLRLVNTRMNMRPEAQTWLTGILQTLKGHPALDLVLFEGDERLVDSNGDGVVNECGGQAEPSFWYGPGGAAASYAEFAIRLGMSLGYPARQLSAQATVGFWNIDSESGNRFATDGHFWFPVRTLKAVFDRIGIPDADRTYALSFYEQRRCQSARSVACPVDVAADVWADETIARVFRTIGTRSSARVVAVELGVVQPTVNGWTSARALEDAVGVMRRRGMEGGSFWRWVHYEDVEENIPGIDEPIKRRGPGLNFYPTADVLRRLYQSP